MACCFKNWMQKTTKPLLGKGFRVNRIGQISNHFTEDLKILAGLVG
jgi:hypothetical protein